MLALKAWVGTFKDSPAICQNRLKLVDYLWTWRQGARPRKRVPRFLSSTSRGPETRWLAMIPARGVENGAATLVVTLASKGKQPFWLQGTCWVAFERVLPMSSEVKAPHTNFVPCGQRETRLGEWPFLGFTFDAELIQNGVFSVPLSDRFTRQATILLFSLFWHRS